MLDDNTAAFIIATTLTTINALNKKEKETTTRLVADCISQKNRQYVSEQAALAQHTRGAQFTLRNPRVQHASLWKQAHSRHVCQVYTHSKSESYEMGTATRILNILSQFHPLNPTIVLSLKELYACETYICM